jgi:hypothetical protein
VERYVDTRQGDGGKPTLQLDISLRFLLTLCLLIARLDDITEHLLNLLDGVGLSQLCKGYGISCHQEPCIYLTYLGDVDLLDLEEVQDVGHGLECQKLSCANILLALQNSQNSSEIVSEARKLTSTLWLTISSRDPEMVAILSTTSRRAASLKVGEMRLGLTAHIA